VSWARLAMNRPARLSSAMTTPKIQLPMGLRPSCWFF
jgi:hypothetical protein